MDEAFQSLTFVFEFVRIYYTISLVSLSENRVGVGRGGARGRLWWDAKGIFKKQTGL